MFARPDGRAGYEDNGTPRGNYYACGWSVNPKGTLEKAEASHTGGGFGTGTRIERIPEFLGGYNYVVLMNAFEGPENPFLPGSIYAFIHRAALKVTKWPDKNLYPEFSKT